MPTIKTTYHYTNNKGYATKQDHCVKIDLDLKVDDWYFIKDAKKIPLRLLRGLDGLVRETFHQKIRNDHDGIPEKIKIRIKY